jgi:hypothetical protein
MVSRLGRGWKPSTELQKLLFDTYTTKANISKVLGLSQPTLILVLKDQQRLNLKQLSRISKDSGKSLMELIKMI